MKTKPIIYYGYNTGSKPEPFSNGSYVVAKQGSKWFTFTPGVGLKPLGDKEDAKDYRSFVRQEIWIPFKTNPLSA